MLRALFAACGKLIGMLVVGGALLGVLWLAASHGGLLGWAIFATVVLGVIAG